MLAFGDHVRRASPAKVVGHLAETIEQLRAAAPGIGRHGDLVATFIAASELAQGLADAEFEARGCDARSPTQDAAMAMLIALAHAVRRSWNSTFAGIEPISGEPLRCLERIRLSDEIMVKTAEGYAYYALYPEGYLAAAARLAGQSLRVIGIRSIGTGLAALVAAAADTPAPITVRPLGDPFRREIRLAPEMRAKLLNDEAAEFAIVDEGPGLSGSSFGAVADYLEASHVAPERIHFFPGHGNDLGPMATATHRTRWRSAQRHVVPFDALVLHGPDPAHRLENWFADLIGTPDGPLVDLSG